VDLHLYLRVLWRFRVLVGAGLLLAITLAVISHVRVEIGGSPTFQYRQSEQWESLATIGVGSNTFLPGSAVDPSALNFLQSPPSSAEEARRRAEEANAGDFSSLPRLNEATVQLMRLATSDDVMRIMREDGKGPIRGALQTFPVTSGDSLVPYITFSAIAAEPGEALALARRHVEAFSKYVRQRQETAGIEEDKRVVLYTVNEPQPAALLEGRKATRPIIVFLAVMTVVVALAFVLENLRPLVRTVGRGDEEAVLVEPQRRRSA
jgi:hypothetical protein